MPSIPKEKSDEVDGFIGFFFGFMASGFFPCRKLYTLSFLKIFTHKAVENYLFAYASVAFQDDFSVLPDCFRKTCFCD